MNWNPISWFPFGKDGRATLVYIFFAGSVPVILGAIVWALYLIRWWNDAPALARLEKFYNITMWLSYGFMLGMVAYAAFVSIRAAKFNAKEGTAEFDGREDSGDIVRSGDDVTVTKS